MWRRAGLVGLGALLLSVWLAPGARALTAVGDGPWFWQAPQPVGLTFSAVAFGDAQNLWAATGASGSLAHSGDGGLTWETRQVAQNQSGFAALQFLDAQQGWAVGLSFSDDALHPLAVRTIDGGASWVDASPDQSGILYDLSFLDAEHGWATCVDMAAFPGGGSLLATGDGGANWQALTIVDDLAPFCVKFIDDQCGFVGDLRGRLWRTTDGGQHWQKSVLSQSSEFAPIMSVDFSDALHGWAIVGETVADVDRYRLMSTSDGGVSWQRQVETVDQLTDVRATADRIYVCGVSGSGPAFVSFSADGGLSWSRRIMGGADLALTAIDVLGETCVAVGTQIVRSDDGGASWRSFTSGTQASLLDGAMVSTTEGWAVGDGIILHTADGARWSEQWRGSRELCCVAFADASNGWAVGDRGCVLHTADGGTSWQRQDAGTTSDLLQVDFPDAEHGWLIVSSPDVAGLVALRTRDGGATWTRVRVGYDVYAEAVRFIDPQHGWVAGQVGSGSGVLHTVDGGGSWSRQKLPAMEYLRDIFFLDEQEGWVAGGRTDNYGIDRAFLAHTVDGGLTWKKLPEVSGALFNSAYFVDSNRGWAAGEDSLFSTTDGGHTWHQEAANRSLEAADVTGVDAEHVWAFGENQILSSFDVTGDSAAPSTLHDSDQLWRRTPVTVGLSANDIGGAGLLRTEYRLSSGGTWTEGSSVFFDAPADHSGDGRHVLRYRSLDLAGNVELTQTCQVLIDTRRPRPVTNWAASVRRGRRASLRYCITDRCPGRPRATVTIRLRNARGTLVKKVTLRDVQINKLLTYSFVCRLPRGTYRFFVSATDAAGNQQTKVGVNRLVVK